MRFSYLLAPLALIAAPALAQEAPPAAAPEEVRLPPELTDPAMAARLGDMMQALSKALLELPVGEIQAAVEGRSATPADKARTVADLGRLDDPDFEKKLERQIAQAQPRIEASMKALAEALPAIMESMADAREKLERAAANMPRPDYPKR